MPRVFASVKEAVKRRSSCSLLHVGGNRQCSQLKTEPSRRSLLKLSDVQEADEVDISQYSQDDLERLRLEDPFLYYSIPQMKRSLFESDASIMKNHSGSSNSSSLRRSSCPSILLDSDASGHDGPQQQQRRGSVTRARRFSVEPHPSLFMQNIMNEMMMDEDDDDSDMDEEDQKLIQALANGTFDVSSDDT